jgi:hypothetical protein
MVMKHINRFINLHHHVNISSSLLLASPKNADDSFKNGFVKYIITDNNTAAADHVQHYYPDYKYLTQTGLFSVYKYNL